MTTEKKLTLTREVLAAIEGKITDLEGKRSARLLNGDAAGAVAKIEDEIAALRREARTESDRAELLTKQLARDEREAIAKRRASLIDRFERKLEVADAKADELQATMAKAEVLFREIIKLREEARFAWPLGDASTDAAANTAEGACLSGIAVRTLLMYECCRIGSRPFLGGNPGEKKQPDFPGGLNPNPLTWQGTPEKITPLATALRQASKFAVDMMRGKLDPLAALPLAEQPRTSAETKLGQLLKQQQQLALDASPEGEEKYRAVITEIATVSAQIDSARNMEQQHGTA